MILNPTSAQLSEADRERLNQILTDPVLVTAVNIALQEAQPRPGDLLKQTPDQNASVANQIAGMSGLVRKLQRLATPLSETIPLEDPAGTGSWGHLEEPNPTT